MGRNQKGRVGRRHHRIPARQRPAGAALSRPLEAKVTVNLTVFVGSRHEGYGETGMAHLLEHMVFKGTPDAPDDPQGAAGPRRAVQRHAPGSTARITTRPCPPATRTWNSPFDLEADRMVNSFVKREDLMSEMTVVRNEFERGENSPARVLDQAHDGRRLRMAQLRQVDDRQPQRHRTRADREPAGVLQKVLPARQRDAGRRGQVRRDEGAGTGRASISARSPSPSASSTRPTPKSRRRTASGW